MTTHNVIEATVRVYTALLHLYPHKFRRAYGALMTQLLQDQCNDAVARRG